MVSYNSKNENGEYIRAADFELRIYLSEIGYEAHIKIDGETIHEQSRDFLDTKKPEDVQDFLYKKILSFLKDNLSNS